MIAKPKVDTYIQAMEVPNMKQIRIGRSPSIRPGQWYLGQDWLPNRPDCYQVYAAPFDGYLTEYGAGSHWMEEREIADDKVDPTMLDADRVMRAKLYIKK